MRTPIIVLFSILSAIAARAQQWTAFTPSPDSRVVYVSAAGNDSNTGLSTAAPKRTLAAGCSLLRSGFPDWVLLRRGDSWSEGFPGWTKSGRSAAEPMRIGSYGAGERPRVLAPGTGLYAGNWSAPLRHLAITDLWLTGAGYDGTGADVSGIAVLGLAADILVENCRVERFCSNLVFDLDTAVPQGDIRVRYTTSAEAYRRGPAIHAQGSYFGGVAGLLIEGCVFDHNGWLTEVYPDAIPTIFRHNIYIQSTCSSVTVRGVISARAAATGMQQRPGGTCEDTLFLRSPLNCVFGGNGVVRRCVAMDSVDIDPTNPRGVGFDVTGGTSTLVEDCLAEWRTGPGTWNISAYAADNAPGVTLQRCVSWSWRSPEENGEPIWSASNPWPVVLDCNMEQRPPRTLRDISTYMSSVGRTGGLNEFLIETRRQERDNWRPEFAAAPAIAYLREPFLCYADMDRDGTLSVADFSAYLQKFAAGDPYANCDQSTASPTLNVGDFTCFLQAFAKGCP